MSDAMKSLDWSWIFNESIHPNYILDEEHLVKSIALYESLKENAKMIYVWNECREELEKELKVCDNEILYISWLLQLAKQRKNKSWETDQHILDTYRNHLDEEFIKSIGSLSPLQIENVFQILSNVMLDDLIGRRDELSIKEFSNEYNNICNHQQSVHEVVNVKHRKSIEEKK